jgi:hypothetical protein
VVEYYTVELVTWCPSSLIKIPQLVQNIWGAGTETRMYISPNLMIILAKETAQVI